MVVAVWKIVEERESSSPSTIASQQLHRRPPSRWLTLSSILASGGLSFHRRRTQLERFSFPFMDAGLNVFEPHSVLAVPIRWCRKLGHILTSSVRFSNRRAYHLLGLILGEGLPQTCLGICPPDSVFIICGRAHRCPSLQFPLSPFQH